MDLMELLGEELGVQVKEKLGDTKLIIDDGKMIPHSRLNEVLSEKKALEEQIKSYDGQLADLKKSAEGNAELTEKLKQLEADNAKAKADYEMAIKNARIDGVIGKEVAKLLPKDEKLVMTLIDKDIIKIDGDNVLGLSEQVESLKQSHPYLFSEKKAEGKPPERGLEGQPKTGRAALIEKYNEAEKSGRFAEMLALQTQIQNTKE